MATQIELIKEIFSTEIRAINEKIDTNAKSQHDLAMQILEQVKRTNGRVNDLDKFKLETEIIIATRVKPEVIDGIQKKIRILEDCNLGKKGFKNIAGGIITGIFATGGFIWVILRIYDYIKTSL